MGTSDSREFPQCGSHSSIYPSPSSEPSNHCSFVVDPLALDAPFSHPCPSIRASFPPKSFGLLVPQTLLPSKSPFYSPRKLLTSFEEVNVRRLNERLNLRQLKVALLYASSLGSTNRCPSRIEERVVIDRTAERNVVSFSSDVGDTGYRKARGVGEPDLRGPSHSARPGTALIYQRQVPVTQTRMARTGG